MNFTDSIKALKVLEGTVSFSIKMCVKEYHHDISNLFLYPSFDFKVPLPYKESIEKRHKNTAYNQ